MKDFNTLDIHGEWFGKCIYGPEYGELENSTLYFKVNFDQNEDTFTGIAIDTGGIGVNPTPANIKGFIDGQDINFVKVYKAFAIFSDNNELEIDHTQSSSEIEYNGTFDASSNSIKGDWAIYTFEDELINGTLEYVATGTWEISRQHID